MIEKQRYLTIKQVADLLGVSRIAVFQKVKKGLITGEKIGRNYVIPSDHIDGILGKTLGEKDIQRLNTCLERISSDFGGILSKWSGR